MVAEEAQVELGERCPAGTWLHVVTQGLHVLVETRLVLGIELEHPGVLVQLIERVLERSPRHRGHARASRAPPLGAQRHQLVEGSDRLPILQQHGLRLRQELPQGSSSANDGATSYSACSSATVAGLRPWTAAPGSGTPAWRKPRRGAASRPASLRRRCRMRPASARKFPAHQ